MYVCMYVCDMYVGGPLFDNASVRPCGVRVNALQRGADQLAGIARERPAHHELLAVHFLPGRATT